MSQDDLPDLAPVLFPIRIIFAALVAGVLAFTVIAVALVELNGPMIAPPDGLLTMALLFCAIAPITLQFFIPQLFLKATMQRLQRSDSQVTIEGLVALYRSHLIVGWAMCEGAAFIGIMAYLLEGNPLGFVVEGVAVLLMFTRFPSASGLAGWLQQQRDWLAREEV